MTGMLCSGSVSQLAPKVNVDVFMRLHEGTSWPRSAHCLALCSTWWVRSNRASISYMSLAEMEAAAATVVVVVIKIAIDW